MASRPCLAFGSRAELGFRVQDRRGIKKSAPSTPVVPPAKRYCAAPVSTGGPATPLEPGGHPCAHVSAVPPPASSGGLRRINVKRGDPRQEGQRVTVSESVQGGSASSSSSDLNIAVRMVAGLREKPGGLSVAEAESLRTLHATVTNALVHHGIVLRGGQAFLTLGTLNTRGIASKFEEHLRFGGVLAMQETGVTKVNARSLGKLARKVDKVVQFSLPSTLRDTDHVSASHGVSVLAGDGWQVCNASKFLTSSTWRIQHVVLSNGAVSIMLHNIYLISGDQHTWWARNGSLIDEILVAVHAFPDHGHVLAGDFQTCVLERNVFADLFIQGWVSVRQHLNRPDTFEGPHGTSGLDDILISPTLAPQLQSCHVSQELWHTDHRLVSVTLNVPSLQSSGLRLRNPPKQWSPEVFGEVARELGVSPSEWWSTQPCHVHASQWSVDDIMQSWFQSLSRWVGASDTYLGNVHFEEKEFTCKHQVLQDSYQWRLHMLRKLCAYMVELAALRSTDRASGSRFGFLSRQSGKLFSQVGWGMPCSDVAAMSREQFAECIKSLKTEIANTQKSASNAYTRWRKTIVEDKTGKELGKWLRASDSALRMVEADQYQTCPHAVTPPEQLRVISEAWKGVLCPGDHATEATPGILRECKRALRTCPVELPPFSIDVLHQEIQHKQSTASGLDQVTMEMLRSLPKEAFFALVIVFENAEETGHWPAQLTAARNVVLPKVGTDSTAGGLQVRLITITSHLYRLWSGKRMSQLSEWLSVYVHPGIYGGVKGKSCQMAAMLHALNWEVAAGEEKPSTQVHFDFSKCFDSLSPVSLCELLQHCGIPKGVVQALRGWYSQHRRWNTIKGWYWPQEVTRGVCQGDPLSVLGCVLWGNALLVLLEEVAPNLCKSMYMDDLSLSGTQRQEIEVGTGLVRYFSDQWHVQLNAAKTQIVQNKYVDDAAQYPATGEQCVLLGIDLGPDARPCQVKQRIAAAHNRLAMFVHLLHFGPGLLERFLPAFVLGLLHGISFVPVDALPEFASLGKAIWLALRGKARYAGTRGLAFAVAFKAHLLCPHTARSCVSARLVRQGIMDPLVGPLIKKVWGKVPVLSNSPWRSFCDFISTVRGYRGSFGEVWIDNKRVLAADMTRNEWSHAVRDLSRLLLFEQGKHVLGGQLEYEDIDFAKLAELRRQAEPHALQTIQMGGVNTCDRSARHFNWGEGNCEWGCLTPDTVDHRLLYCVSTEADRERSGMNLGVREFLTAQPVECLRHGIPHAMNQKCPHDHLKGLQTVFDQEELSNDLAAFQRHVLTCQAPVVVHAWLQLHPSEVPGWGFQICMVEVLDSIGVAIHTKIFRAHASFNK
eukprot:6461558-Amphidinium_carterae.1